METIINLQKDEKLLEKEGDKYCLVSLESKHSFSKKDVENQSNFAVIEIITAYKRGFITGDEANTLINKIDTYEFSYDLLGPEKTIQKLNYEIIGEGLKMPSFHYLCVECDSLV